MDITMDFGKTRKSTAIDFHPQTVAEEVIQNVRNIIATPKFSVPLQRELGIDFSCVDGPMTDNIANIIRSEIFMAIKRYEPRCEITQIDFEASPSGDGIVIRLQVAIREEVQRD